MDRAILVGQRFRESRQIGLVTVVVLIEHRRRDDARRRRRHETFAKTAAHSLEPCGVFVDWGAVYILDIGQRGWRVRHPRGVRKTYFRLPGIAWEVDLIP